MKWSRSAWASAEPSVGSVPGAELVEQDERVRSRRLDDRRDPAQVAGERRERLRHRLLVADVGEDVAPDRQAAAGGGRDVQTRLVHQAQQPQRPQGHGLAAGVRPGDDERRVAVADPDVDGDHLAREARVAGGQQDDLGTVGRLGARAVEVGGKGRLGGPQVEAGQRIERLAQGRRIGRDQRRELIEDPCDLLLFGDLGLAPGVPELDGDERLHEQGLAAARSVVDDALHPGTGLGLDRDDVAAVAQRHDRFLERVAQLRADQRVQPPPEAVVRHAHGRAQATQAWRGRVEQLTDRIEAAGQRAADGRQGMELATEVAQQCAALVRERRGESRGRVQGVGDLEELAGIEPSAARGALDRGADVVGAADPDPGSLLEQRADLVGLVELAGDDDRVRRRLERFGESAGWRERGGVGEPLADERELEQVLRAGVHQPETARGPETDGWPTMANRHGRAAQSSPA